MIGGNLFGRILSFARGLFSKAAPHISNLISQTQSHVKKVAAKAIDSAIDKAVEHVTEKIRSQQQGSGKKRKRLKKPRLKNSKL